MATLAQVLQQAGEELIGVRRRDCERHQGQLDGEDRAQHGEPVPPAADGPLRPGPPARRLRPQAPQRAAEAKTLLQEPAR